MTPFVAFVAANLALLVFLRGDLARRGAPPLAVLRPGFQSARKGIRAR
jgi:hypothetical protein